MYRGFEYHGLRRMQAASAGNSEKKSPWYFSWYVRLQGENSLGYFNPLLAEFESHPRQHRIGVRLDLVIAAEIEVGRHAAPLIVGEQRDMETKLVGRLSAGAIITAPA